MIDYPKLQAQLQELIAGFAAETYSTIEYGDAAHVGGYASYLRIRYLPTPAGMQFAVKEVRAHVEGSGVYFQDAAECIKYALDRVAHYHRPLPLHLQNAVATLRKKSSPELSFFSVTEDGLAHSRQLAASLVRYRLEKFSF